MGSIRQITTLFKKNIGQGGVYSFGCISEPDPQYKGTKNFLDYQIIMDFFLWKFFVIFINMIWYYFLIGLGFSFIIETTSKQYAEEIRILNNDDEVFESFTMMERLILITIWPIGIWMVVKELIKKDDET